MARLDKVIIKYGNDFYEVPIGTKVKCKLFNNRTCDGIILGNKSYTVGDSFKSTVLIRVEDKDFHRGFGTQNISDNIKLKCINGNTDFQTVFIDCILKEPGVFKITNFDKVYHTMGYISHRSTNNSDYIKLTSIYNEFDKEKNEFISTTKEMSTIVRNNTNFPGINIRSNHNSPKNAYNDFIHDLKQYKSNVIDNDVVWKSVDHYFTLAYLIPHNTYILTNAPKTHIMLAEFQDGILNYIKKLTESIPTFLSDFISVEKVTRFHNPNSSNKIWVYRINYKYIE